MKCALFTAISMSVLLAPSAVLSKTESTYPPAWGQHDAKRFYSQSERQVSPRTPHVHAKRSSHPPIPQTLGKTAPPLIARLQADIASLRRELAEVRTEIGQPALEPSPLARMIAVYPRFGLQKPLEEPNSAFNLPGLGLGSAVPEGPSLPLLGRIAAEAVDRVQAARVYLAQTATIGFTMARQGPEVALGRLHPDFAVRLAEAVKRAREVGLIHCGVFSAYRPPVFGVGGFSNKFNSLHSYGLAADMTGIGGPGSSSAKLWQKIVKVAGLFLPYGVNNHAEYNHTQLISNKMAIARLRGTITASGPKDLQAMWLASGVLANVLPGTPINSAKLLPINEYAQ